MNTTFFSSILLLSALFSLSPVSSHAQSNETFELYSRLTSWLKEDTGSISHNYQRADVWAYELSQLSKFPVEKILVLSSATEVAQGYSYYVAPTIEVDGTR